MSSRPGSSGGRRGRDGGNTIDKLDYSPGRPLLRTDDETDSPGRASGEHSYAGSFFEQVAEGILDRDRKKMKREVRRYLGFVWAIINWYVECE